jgi:hypothetical protein
MFYTKLVEKMKDIFYFRKLQFMTTSENVETRGATNDVRIWRIRVACWISKITCIYAYAQVHAPGYAYARTHAQTNK